MNKSDIEIEHEKFLENQKKNALKEAWSRIHTLNENCRASGYSISGFSKTGGMDTSVFSIISNYERKKAEIEAFQAKIKGE